MTTLRQNLAAVTLTANAKATGQASGVNLASLNWSGWSWQSDFAWGRRVLKAGEFTAP